MQLPPYTTGTVSIADGDTTLVFTGGIITDLVARRGDVIYVNNQQPGVEIFARTDLTRCEIAVPWSSGDMVDVPFTIVQNFPARVAGAEAAEDVTRLVAALNTNGLPWLVPSNMTEPDPSWGDEQQLAEQRSTGKQWHKEGGAWVYDGLFKAFGAASPYDAGKTYSLNDIATLGGSSYVWINPTPGTGHAPPNASYWDVLAAKGEQGIQGVTGASYAATSASSRAIGAGPRTFATQTGLAYTTGARVRVSSASAPSNWMEGVATYSGSTLSLEVDKTNGSGTFADWNVNLAGQPGAGDLSSANNLSDLTDKENARGNLGVLTGPQGRLTLTPGVAIQSSDVVNAPAIYYAPLAGNQVPVYDGTKFVMRQFVGDLVLQLDDNSGHSMQQIAGYNYDLFAVMDGPSLRLASSEPWVVGGGDSFVRGTGAGSSELQWINGIATNKNVFNLRFGNASGDTLSNVPANRATYLGTFNPTLSGRATDSRTQRLLFNAYNQVQRPVSVTDPATLWHWDTASWRLANGNVANHLEIINGFDYMPVDIEARLPMSVSVVNQSPLTGIGVNSQSVNSAASDYYNNPDTSPHCAKARLTKPLALGLSILWWLEYGPASGSSNMFGSNSGAQLFSTGLDGTVTI